MAEAVILVCPCCASPVDAVSDPNLIDTIQYFHCVVCDQRWSMTVDAARHATHSLS